MVSFVEAEFVGKCPLRGDSLVVASAKGVVTLTEALKKGYFHFTSKKAGTAMGLLNFAL